jgi:hypothetical protein
VKTTATTIKTTIVKWCRIIGGRKMANRKTINTTIHNKNDSYTKIKEICEDVVAGKQTQPNTSAYKYSSAPS